jgi:glycosyltransferase involved in cell wall biosynthesis
MTLHSGNVQFISIITVVYNSEQLIENTLKNIALIKNSSIEYIVIDGASTDKTNEIIKRYLSIIDIYVSERDGGIYDAMNKGINLSSGKFISFLNSGDIYVSDFVKLIKDNLSDDFDFFSFGIYEKNIKGILNLKLPKEIDLYNYDPQFMYMPHPGILVKRKLFEQYDSFDVKFKSASDLDWVNRVLFVFPLIKIKLIKKPLVIFLLGGMSSSYVSYSETRLIAIKYGKSIFKSYWVFIKQIILLYFYKFKKFNDR